MGSLLPFPFRCFLPEHHLLAEVGNRTSTILTRQQRYKHHRWREIYTYFRGESKRRAIFQRGLRRVQLLIVIVAPCGRLLPYPM